MAGEALADARDMFAVHTAFRREFGLMAELVLCVDEGDMARVAPVTDHVTLLTTMLTAHHAGEDRLVWPRLRERCGLDDADRIEIAKISGLMEEQHEAIQTALDRLAAAVRAWRPDGATSARAAVIDAIDSLAMVGDHHLALEEARVVPLIEKYITAREYAALARETAARLPAAALPVIVGMLMYEADIDVIDTVAWGMRGEAGGWQPVDDLATGAYAAYARELYGVDAPPRVTR